MESTIIIIYVNICIVLSMFLLKVIYYFYCVITDVIQIAYYNAVIHYIIDYNTYLLHNLIIYYKQYNN